ncbi:polyribonucleotide nucleotidyltransferase [candidate division GN15 bacterium]|uniref:Polyribonucleotide nucleotidyltransferase n=1 Tax=candidate division GN15 bacterium TaxID=2072418 RepID=A0A855X1A6_9BACT|nr:MAG: polyribonucleotide nucleotidyltransferase [candidate division GN15 bacterium]
MVNKVEFEIGGRMMTIETGKMAKQANGAVTVRYADSMVIATVCAATEPREGQDFFPLTVEYREKSYAAGKIPGGFFKREGRPSEKEILSARIIDRPIRPLFPDDFKGDTQCIAYVISHDQKNDTDVLALIGTAAAIAVSDIPIAKTIAGVRVGRIDGQLVINPQIDTLDESDLNITMAGSADSIAMVEGSAREVSEDVIIEALMFGHDHIKMIVAKIDELKAAAGKPVFEYTKSVIDPAIVEKVKELAGAKYDKFNRIADKDSRRTEKKKFQTEVLTALAETFPEKEANIKEVLEEIDAASMRSMILRENIRIDGRGPDDIRDITCEVGLLPRAHGSALFTRGQTQALVAVTLGTKIDEQRLDELEGESTKSYMLHYNFPPFSTGETKPIRGTSRREIGHGNLAERALQPVIPAETSFPYTVRVVSDVMESNGSSSMATVCGASLALMDAGVPIKTAIAGIAMGLIKENDKVVILTDILGDEDHFGDMDFKVAGSTVGVTSIQMDIKITGLDIETMRQALGKARKARLAILDKMNATIHKHRDQLSEFAPRILILKINPSKIGEVIGPGGKIIRAIVEETGAKIDISDDGTVFIASVSAEAGKAALARVQAIVEEPEMGKVYNGVVRRVTDFGAFVEIIPGTDGLVHISELDVNRVKRVEDICRVGDRIEVKVINIDSDGKVRLSRKALLTK